MGKQRRWLGRHDCLSAQCSRCERASHSALRWCLPLDSARCVGLVCQTLGEKREQKRGRIGEWQVRGWSFSRGLWCGPSHVILLIKDSSFSSCTCQPYYLSVSVTCCHEGQFIGRCSDPLHISVMICLTKKTKSVILLMIGLEEEELFKKNIALLKIFLFIFLNNLHCLSSIFFHKKLLF